MKKIISLILLLVMAFTILTGCNTLTLGNNQTSYDLSKVGSRFEKSNTQFALNIFKQINEANLNQSIFISPLSISSALGMTYNGAKGKTSKEMAEALNYGDMDLEAVNGNYKSLLAYLEKVDPKIQLDISNSIWFKKGETIKSDFLSLNQENYNATIKELDFKELKAADTINEWVKTSTKGKIDKILEPPIPDDAIMYLINAIYFKGKWTDTFNKKNSFTKTFNMEGGKKKEANMMSRTGEIEYGEVDKTKIVRLPYGNGKTAMYAILPKKGIKIDDYIQELSMEKWSLLKASISKKDKVILQIPSFKLESVIKSLKPSLAALGMKEAFDPSKADFSGIREDAFISNIVHKAVIEVNEEGSEAAAVTSVEVGTTSMPLDQIEFIADRPFIFMIMDDESGTILFMGKLSDI